MNIINLAVLIIACILIGLCVYILYDKSSYQDIDTSISEKSLGDPTQTLVNLIGKPIYRVSDCGDRSYNDPTDMICIPVKKIADQIIVKFSFLHIGHEELSLEILDSRFYDDYWIDATPFLQQAINLEKELNTQWEFNKLQNVIQILKNEGIDIENNNVSQFTYVEITSENLLLATEIQLRIFPEDCAYLHYKSAIDRNSELEKYYLVYSNNEIIGITGLYSNEDIYETRSIWLGWFGILPQYRRNGYGERILFDTIEMAKNLCKEFAYPIKYFRLYTSERENKEAQFLYQKVMDLSEYYINEQDINYDNHCVIFSKNLFEDTDCSIEPWDNKFLDLKGIEETQSEGNEIIKKLMNNKIVENGEEHQ